MSSPNILLSVSSFLIIAIIFYIYKFFILIGKLDSNLDKTSLQSLTNYTYSFLKNTNYYTPADIFILVLVLLTIMFSQYFLNLYNSNLLCGSTQPQYCIFNTLLSWGIFTFIFILANKFWLKPFSNTFGYLFLSIFMQLPARIKEIFGKDADLYIGKEWIFVNELNYSLEPNDFKEKWSKKNNKVYQEGGQQPDIAHPIMNDNNSATNDKPGADNTSPNESVRVDRRGYILYTLLQIKNLVSESIWFILIGLLALSYSYSHLMSNQCNISPEKQVQSFNEYNSTQINNATQDINDEDDDAPPKRKYVSG